MRSLLVKPAAGGKGGIAFATPDNPSDTPAKNGMGFPLYYEAMKEWLEWMPKIPIPVQPN
jgi:hypothetical protein